MTPIEPISPILIVVGIDEQRQMIAVGVAGETDGARKGSYKTFAAGHLSVTSRYIFHRLKT